MSLLSFFQNKEKRVIRKEISPRKGKPREAEGCENLDNVRPCWADMITSVPVKNSAVLNICCRFVTKVGSSIKILSSFVSYTG
jgi:hypothetical protein